MKCLRFFHRPGCHLCEEMLEQLEALKSELGFQLQQLDVDADAQLRARYHTRVPVLEDAEGNLLCEVFLDPVSVMSYLQDA
ncbi:MAG: glutaredoxin family protein [Candidatus Thiodiazotropha sp.]